MFGYGLVEVKGKAGEIIKDFYWNVTKPYWDAERDHIEAKYQTIPFPFQEIKSVPHFDMSKEVTLEQLVGYIGTWSAVQHYKKHNGYSPIEPLKKSLERIWDTETTKVSFPVFIRLGSNG